MPLLQIKNLTVEFKTGSGAFRAVDGVSLSVDKGEVLAIVGESGSGKSVSMLADTRDLKSSHFWVTAFPGIVILITVLLIYLVGDRLRCALDAQLRRS